MYIYSKTGQNATCLFSDKTRINFIRDKAVYWHPSTIKIFSDGNILCNKPSVYAIKNSCNLQIHTFDMQVVLLYV